MNSELRLGFFISFTDHRTIGVFIVVAVTTINNTTLNMTQLITNKLVKEPLITNLR